MIRIDDYTKELKKRAKDSHIYQSHQLVGLEIAKLVEDDSHKSLYMKLAREHGSQRLFELAKRVAEKKSIKNKGAYFMRILSKEGLLSKKKK